MQEKGINQFWQGKQVEIHQWIQDQYGALVPPIYSSMDIRDAGFKVAHVDSNLFPAGFNNVPIQLYDAVQKQFSDYLQRYWPNCNKLYLIGESFNRNQGYQKNLQQLARMLDSPPRQCRFGTISDLSENGGFLEADGWRPDLLLLNSDLTAGVPEILRGVRQPIVPSPDLGWHSRSKYKHFCQFNKTVTAFAQHFGVDPWLLSTYNAYSAPIDFREKTGLDLLAGRVEDTLQLIKVKYREYGITVEPYVFIKIDNGTFGAGIMTAKNPEDIININKKNRHSMDRVRSDVAKTDAVLVQEGIPTRLKWGDAPAEQVCYTIGGHTAFSFVRYNNGRDQFSNLNSKGMNFSTISSNDYNLSHIVSHLAVLASVFESVDS